MQYVILLIPESVLNLRVWIHAVMLNFGFGHRSTHWVKTESVLEAAPEYTIHRRDRHGLDAPPSVRWMRRSAKLRIDDYVG